MQLNKYVYLLMLCSKGGHSELYRAQFIQDRAIQKETFYVVLLGLCEILQLSLECLSLVEKELNSAKARVQDPSLPLFAFTDYHCQVDKWALTEAEVIQTHSKVE